MFDVVVWGTPGDPHTASISVQELLIDTPGGGQVRLGDVADVQVAPTPHGHPSTQTSRGASTSRPACSGRDVGAVTDDVRSALAGVDFPLEYHAELLGDYAERQPMPTEALRLRVAAAIAIFLLLQAAFGSWRLAAVIVPGFPARARRRPVAIALDGRRRFAGLRRRASRRCFAIAVRTGVTLVRRFRQLEHEEGVDSARRCPARGRRAGRARSWRSPSAAGLALLPGRSRVRPARRSRSRWPWPSSGGLITSVLLNLLVFPNLYLRFGGTATAAPVSEENRSLSPEIEPVSGA